MPKHTRNLPMREKHSRDAKDKAAVEISNYFQPKRILQVIPEDDTLSIKPKLAKSSKKDKNNNTKTKTATKNKKGLLSKPVKDRNIKNEHADHNDDDDDDDEKEWLNDPKRKKVVIINKTINDDTTDLVSDVTSTPIGKNAQKSSMSLSPSTSTSSQSSSGCSTSSIEVILDSSIDTNRSMDIDTSTNGNSTSSSYHRSNYRTAANYNFDALETDDETDTEDNTPYAPQWSKFKNRIDLVIGQERIKSNVIDAFFGCHAQSVDSKQIFPNTLPIARRRSTAVWNTPPRYSMLPKY